MIDIKIKSNMGHITPLLFLLVIVFSFSLVSIGEATPLKIMGVGDSITEGNVGNYTYLCKLKTLFASNNIDIVFVGNSITSSAYGSCAGIRHNGYHSQRINYFTDSSRIENFLTQTPADVVLIHLGTNDIFQNYQIATAPTRLGVLIDRISAKSPNTKIIVSSIIPMRDYPANSWNEATNSVTYNKAIPGIIAQKKSEGKNVYYVDMWSKMDLATDYSKYEYLHPNRFGSDKMAGIWFNAITTNNPTPTVTRTPIIPSSPIYTNSIWAMILEFLKYLGFNL